jgi:ATP-binding cassette subfamily B (MDR/TAP) protein 1
VTIYIPASETTFIVGGSGSGKSTIAQLLLRMYDVQRGTISLDDQDVEYLDTNWTRQHIGVVSQGAILFDMTVHDNVAMGLAGPGSKRRPQDATRSEVIEACRTALLHRFIEDLPDGYETQLGNGGANLSGGQRQRLAIARAILRDPTVLILGKL